MDCLRTPNQWLLMKLKRKYTSLSLATDWSKTDIGFSLFQNTATAPSPEPFCCNTGSKTTLVGSRFTYTAESCYALVEGEALTVADALDKAIFFVPGCSDLIIAVDHKLLLKVLSDRSLEEISNARLHNLKEKTLHYKFFMMHFPGIQHKAADTVFHHPIGHTNPDMMLLPDDIAASGASDIPPLFNPSGHSFLTGICCRERPASCTTVDDELASLVSSSLNTLAITWDCIKGPH